MAEHPQSVVPQKLLSDVAVVFRDTETAGGLVDRLSEAASLRANGFSIRLGRLGERVVALGINGESASLTAMVDAIVHAHKPKLVIIGTQAIGVAEDMQTNTVLLASSLVAESSKQLELPPWTNSTCKRGLLWATNQLAKPPAPEILAAIPLDLYPATMWCRERDIAVEITAVISHHASAPPPADVRKVINQPSLAGRMGAFLGAAWRRPSSVPDLWRQKESVWVAREKLGDAIDKLVVPKS